MGKQAFGKQPISSFNTIGLMSGTSLDGLDVCLAEYSNTSNGWCYSILKAKTYSYSIDFKEELKNAHSLSALEISEYSVKLGKWFAQRVNEFKQNVGVDIDYVGSHGHTVFHNPSKGFTTQIGSGAHIAAETRIPCICDFRSGDVARGGQGAPLVPVGDELLFGQYDFCLNIGGIANISFKDGDKRVAFDICPSNMILNYLVNQHGLDFDKNGEWGKTGRVDNILLDKLNKLDFYKRGGARSLGREWFEESFSPIISHADLPFEDKLRTVYEHISCQISKVLTHKKNGSVLVTGGGARNGFLVELIKEKCENSVIVPNELLIDFKEALVFGFLAVLYHLKIDSCLASVTGARSDSVGGCLYL